MTDEVRLTKAQRETLEYAAKWSPTFRTKYTSIYRRQLVAMGLVEAISNGTKTTFRITPAGRALLEKGE